MSDSIVLIGGQWFEGDTPGMDILRNFQFLDMPYFIVQTLEYPTQFRDDGLTTWLGEGLLRLHAFGEGGDLTIRRDEDCYYWRYVGTKVSAAGLDGDFFKGDLAIDDSQAQKALLYGEYKGNGQWQENIVGAAKLTYPQELQPTERVMIHAHAVTAMNEHDEVEVVAYWTYEFTAYGHTKEVQRS